MNPAEMDGLSVELPSLPGCHACDACTQAEGIHCYCCPLGCLHPERVREADRCAQCTTEVARA